MRLAHLDGIYEEHDDGGKLLCHVFAGGKRIATFEPQGGVFGYRLKTKRWDDIAKTAELAFLWPLQENRAPGTVMLLTLLGVLIASITARRGWRWNPNASVLRALRALATLAHRMGEGLGVRATGVRADKQLETQNSKPETFLTPRERRRFLQPLWRQALSVLLIVALVLATTNTSIHAAIPNPIFYYHVGDHLGSSNLVTDRNGALVQHREYWAFGQQRVRSESGQDYVFNRYTGQIFDDETGLYYYGSRYYDPELGRFTQPDTIVPSPGDPQTLNRYSYVNNNPLKYVDPSGHFVVEFLVGVLIAAVVGAGIGAAVSAARGGDPLQGAAMGAISGALLAIGGPFGLPGVIAAGAAAGAINASIYGGDVGKAALIGGIAAGVGYGLALSRVGLRGAGRQGWTEAWSAQTYSTVGRSLPRLRQ